MSKISPVVSIIIPTFNHAHFLPHAVKSAFDQTFRDFEVIVVDDGSTDNTRDVARTFTDGRFRYIYQSNRGLAASRNRGVNAALGEFLVFLDADDILLPCKLEVQVNWIQAHRDNGLVASGWNYIDEQGELLKARRPWLDVPHLEVRDWLFGCPAVPHSVLVSKQWFERVGGFDEYFRRGVEDWDLWLRLAYAGCKMEWVKEIVCGYRLSPGQMTRDATGQKRFAIHAMDKFYSQLDLPPHLQSLKSEAYTRLYLAQAGREYGAGQCEDAKESITHAINLTPQLLDTRQTELLNVLLSWADNPYVGDPIDYTQRVFSNPPEEAAAVFNARKRWALGEIGLRTLYGAYRARDWPQVQRAWRVAALNAPQRMLDRGIWSILWQSFRRQNTSQ